MAVLPPRELFERPMGLLQSEAIVAAWHHTGAVAFQTAEYPITAPVPAAQRKEPAPPAGARRALPGFEMQVEIDASSGAPRIVDAWGSSVGLAPWGNDLRTFVDVNRSIFGVPADRRVRVVFADGHRDDVELQYPNGAVSEGGLGAETPGDSAHGPELVDGPDHRFRVRNRLPPVSPAFSALPTLSAEDAVAQFVDGAPYVELVPLRNMQSRDKKPLLARLVVTRARNGTSLLAWKLRFRYPCWSWGLPPSEPARLSEREGNAYVDAHSGVVYRDGVGWGSVR